MDYLGVDTTFVKPHLMDVKELLEAAELADKHHEDELFKKRMALEEREGKQHSLEDLARSGKKHDKEYKKRMKERVEGYRFKTIHRDEEDWLILFKQLLTLFISKRAATSTKK